MKRVGLIALGLLAACAKAPVAVAQAPVVDESIAVRSALVSRQPVARVIRGSGLLATKDELSLAFKVGGVLAEVEGRVGQRVSKGQVLARLDATEVGAAVAQAREGLAKATRDYERLKTLYDKGEVALADFQNVTTARAVAQANVNAAEFNLKHAVISSPVAGWIVSRKGESGEVVGPGQTIFRVNGESRGFVVRVSLSDRDALALQVGDEATVSIDALTDRKWAAQVAEIARTASPLTGTFEVELRLHDADDVVPNLRQDVAPKVRQELFAGLSCKVEVQHRNAAQLSVPLAALVGSKGREASVYVIEERTMRARKVPVQVAFLAGDRAALHNGLDGAQRVATEGASELFEGARVTVTP